MARNTKQNDLAAVQMAHSDMVDAILNAIEDGSLQPGDRLPSEVGLAKQYDISTTSVRRGLRLLQEDGIIARRRGSGSYVRDRQPTPTAVRPPAGAAPSTRRTTVALILPIALRVYHPFFTEQLAGIRRGLAELGWQVDDLGYNKQANTGGSDLQYIPVEPQTIAKQLSESGAAGAILGGSLADQVVTLLESPLPVVVPDHSTVCPHVVYDWDSEYRRLLEQLAGGGARRIWCCSQRGLESLPESLRERLPKVIWYQPPRTQLLSELTTHAYHAASKVLQQDPEIDAMFASSDFELEGILNAVQQAGAADRVRVAGLVNRGVRLQPGIRLITAVADGAAKGQTLARLLNEQIIAPESAPNRIVMTTDLYER